MKRFIPWLALIMVIPMVAACGRESTPTTIPEPTITSPPAVSVVLQVSSERSAIAEGPTDAAPPPDSPPQTGGSSGFSQYVFEEVGGEVLTTLVEGPRGEQVRSPMSYLDLKELYTSGGPPPEELGMSAEELGKLVRQLDTVRDTLDKYQDIAVAIAEGYEQLGGDVPNMGVHFVNQRLV